MKLFFIFTIIVYPFICLNAIEEYKGCSGCHGINGDKSALGKSQIINNMTKEEIANALHGYKNNSYGREMKGVMRGQVVKLNEPTISKLATYIASLNQTKIPQKVSIPDMVQKQDASKNSTLSNTKNTTNFIDQSTIEEVDLVRPNNVNLVYSTINNLIWQDDIAAISTKKLWSDGLIMKEYPAKEYCENLSLEGLENWRLPTPQELLKIVDKKNIPTLKYGFVHKRGENYWSSSEAQDDSSSATVVYFFNGSLNKAIKNSLQYVRCVHDKQGVSASLLSEFEKQKNVLLDKNGYKKALKENTIASFNEYMTLYPNGLFKEDAEEDLKRLIYEQYKNKNSIDAYKEYIAKYPDSKYIDDMTDEIDKLQYEEFKNKNTIEAYKLFISKYPASQYVEDAKENIEIIYWDKAKQNNNVNSYNEYLKLYPNGLYSNRALTILEDIDPIKIAQREKYLNDKKEEILKNGWTAVSQKLDRLPTVNCQVNDKDINTNYKGDCKNGRANGFGKATGRDTYVGFFKDGDKHGLGLYKWSDNDYYDGNWMNDEKNGWGERHEPNCIKRFMAIFGCTEWGYPTINKGIFKNGEFQYSCGSSEKGCNLLTTLKPQINQFEENLQCEKAKDLENKLRAIGESYFDYGSCTSKRDFENILVSNDPQKMFLRAVKFENNGERSRAKRIYGTIMDKFENHSMAVKAAERLAALSDVEAVESSQRQSANAIDRANRDAAQRSKDECNAKRNACFNSCSNIKDYSSRSNCQSGCIICNY